MINSEKIYIIYVHDYWLLVKTCWWYG